MITGAGRIGLNIGGQHGIRRGTGFASGLLGNERGRVDWRNGTGEAAAHKNDVKYQVLACIDRY